MRQKRKLFHLERNHKLLNDRLQKLHCITLPRNSGAKSSQTQDIFHKLVDDTITDRDYFQNATKHTHRVKCCNLPRHDTYSKQNDNFGKSNQTFQ